MKLQQPRRPVNFMITTKGLQGKKTTIDWYDGEKGNSNLILTKIFPSVREMWQLKIFASCLFVCRQDTC